MGADVEISIHEAIVFNWKNVRANRFLKQYPASVFFIGEQFVDCFPVPFGLTCQGWDALPLQAKSDFPKASQPDTSHVFSISQQSPSQSYALNTPGRRKKGDDNHKSRKRSRNLTIITEMPKTVELRTSLRASRHPIPEHLVITVSKIK